MTNDNQELFNKIAALTEAGNIKEAISIAEEKYPEGIYFNMPFDDYCNLPYFSRSLSKEVLFDLEEAKYSLTNSTEETPAMALGTAIHSMFLEPEDFQRTYTKEPSPLDFPEKTILRTADDFKEILKSVGEKVSGKKDEIVERAKDYLDPEKHIIWDEVISSFYQDVAENKKKVLSPEDFKILQDIRFSYSMRNDIPRIIQNGYPEVTIIWKDEETGIMCKCRLDWVRPEAIADVKSFSVKFKDKSLFEYLFRQTTYNYYNYQFYIYQQALESIIKKINAGKAKSFGEVDEAWMKEFLATPSKQFFIVYVRTAAPYQMKGIELERSNAEGGTANSYFEVAEENWKLALAKFSRALESGVWKENEIAVMEDSHVPGVIYQSSIL